VASAAALLSFGAPGMLITGGEGPNRTTLVELLSNAELIVIGSEIPRYMSISSSKFIATLDLLCADKQFREPNRFAQHITSFCCFQEAATNCWR
jgi:hypothetical protein